MASIVLLFAWCVEWLVMGMNASLLMLLTALFVFFYFKAGEGKDEGRTVKG